jgi:hypothetical protein
VTFADRLARPVVAGLLWLALFSALYTAGDEVGAWPKFPPGAFRNLDLVVGLVAGVALMLLMLKRPTRRLRAEN